MALSLGSPLSVGPSDRSTRPRPFEALAAGLHTSTAIIAHDGSQHSVSFELTPLGARWLLGVPAAELARTIAELDDLLGSGLYWSFGTPLPVLERDEGGHWRPGASTSALACSVVALPEGSVQREAPPPPRDEREEYDRNHDRLLGSEDECGDEVDDSGKGDGDGA